MGRMPAALLVVALLLWVGIFLLVGCGETDPVGTYRLLSADDIVDRGTLTLRDDGTFVFSQHQVADGKTVRGEGTYMVGDDGLRLDDGQLTYEGELDGDRLTLRFTFEGVELRQEWEKE